MLVVWAFGGSAHPSKKTYAQATLIITGVVIVLGVLIGILVALLAPHATASSM
jgi:VIT1/CCC1 family predicted Fe2+/Mn2+ transporter